MQRRNLLVSTAGALVLATAVLLLGGPLLTFRTYAAKYYHYFAALIIVSLCYVGLGLLLGGVWWLERRLNPFPVRRFNLSRWLVYSALLLPLCWPGRLLLALHAWPPTGLAPLLWGWALATSFAGTPRGQSSS